MKTLRMLLRMQIVAWLSGTVLAVTLIGSAAAAQTVTVGYYPGWPTTQLIGQAKGWFSKALGVDVQFRQFQSSSDMALALASGSVQIVYSLGIIPLVQGVSTNVPYKMIGVAVSYESADNCVARNGSGIKTPKDLIGKKVGVPFSSVSQYKLLKILKRFNIPESKLKIYDMDPPSIAAAMKRGDIDAGCAWQPALSSMLEDGHVIVSAQQESRWGIKVFDTIVTSDSFAKAHPKWLTEFLATVDRSTRFYKEHPSQAIPLIAKQSGLSQSKARKIMSEMTFPTKKAQLSQKWMGTSKKPGEVIPFMAQVANFLNKRGKLEQVKPDYGVYVNPSFYEKVGG